MKSACVSGAVLAAAAIALAAAGCQVSHNAPAKAARASDHWTKSYSIAPGGEFQIVGREGSVSIEGSDGQSVEVDAERVARAANDTTAREVLPRITIAEDVAPDKVVLRSEKLGGIVIGVSIEINYRVKVPRSLGVRVRTEGTTTVANMDGKISLTSVNGNIEGKALRGGLQARATNGSVTVELAALGTEPIEMRTVNGNLDLALPADANAFLSAGYVNGTFDAKDIKFQPDGEQSPRRARGRINAGGTPIELSTTNGTIRVHPRP